MIEEMIAELKSTFWSDFTIADMYGEHGIRDTFNRAFNEWKTNTEYITELTLVLNWKIRQRYEKDEAIAKVYDELWRKCDEWCLDNLKGEDLKYFINRVD